MRGPGDIEYRSAEHGDDSGIRKRGRGEENDFENGEVGSGEPGFALDASTSDRVQPFEIPSLIYERSKRASYESYGDGNPEVEYGNPVSYELEGECDTNEKHDDEPVEAGARADWYGDEEETVNESFERAGDWQTGAPVSVQSGLQTIYENEPEANENEQEVEYPYFEEVEEMNPDADENEDPFVFLETEDPNRTVYKIVINPTGECYSGTSDEAILLKWHYRLGHVNMRYLLRVAPGIPGMEELCKIKSSVKIPTCQGCALGKMKARPLPKATFKRAKEPLDRLHLDMSGQIHCKSYGGHQYYLAIVDDATGYKWTYVLKNKTDYLACIDHLFVRLGEMPKVLRGTPRAMRTDNAGEMISAEAREYMRTHRIWHELCN